MTGPDKRLIGLPCTQRQNETHIRIYYISDYMKYCYSQRSAKAEGAFGKISRKGGDAWQILVDFLQQYTISCKLCYFAVVFAFRKFFTILLAKLYRNYIVYLSKTADWQSKACLNKILRSELENVSKLYYESCSRI